MTIDVQPPSYNRLKSLDTRFALQQDRWNDFGFQTLYHLHYRHGKPRISSGPRGMKLTAFTLTRFVCDPPVYDPEILNAGHWLAFIALLAPRKMCWVQLTAALTTSVWRTVWCRTLWMRQLAGIGKGIGRKRVKRQCARQDQIHAIQHCHLQPAWQRPDNYASCHRPQKAVHPELHKSPQSRRQAGETVFRSVDKLA